MLRRSLIFALSVALFSGGLSLAAEEAGAATVLSTSSLQARLQAKGFYRGPIDGSYGQATQQAVMAFRKEIGASRSYSWSTSLDDDLANYVRPWTHFRLDQPDRVEVNLTRQVLYVFRGGAVRAIIPIASGNGEPFPDENGNIKPANSPTGSFKIYRHSLGWKESYLGELFNPWTFYGGFAIHGSLSVPAYPASHGCIRVTMWDSEWLESQLFVGMPVHVWYEPANVGPTITAGGTLGVGGSVSCSGNCDSVAFNDRFGRFYQWDAINHNPSINAFYYGNPGDLAFSGDWDGDGVKTPGLYRRSDGFVYLRNSNDQGVADITFFFGNPGDIAIAGDFNGDGRDTVSIYRPSQEKFYIINELGSNGGGLGKADYSFRFGAPGDVPIVGDFNGDGVDSVGVHRPSNGQVYLKNSLSGGFADKHFTFGNPNDKMIAGDWNGNGKDTVAVYRPSTGVLYVKNSNGNGVADGTFDVGYLVGAVTISGH